VFASVELFPLDLSSAGRAISIVLDRIHPGKGVGNKAIDMVLITYYTGGCAMCMRGGVLDRFDI